MSTPSGNGDGMRRLVEMAVDDRRDLGDDEVAFKGDHQQVTGFLEIGVQTLPVDRCVENILMHAFQNGGVMGS
jgi:hypothetical protein